jgi:hypothetical protein
MIRRILLSIGFAAMFCGMVFYGSYKCPEDNCRLMWVSTEFCQGVRCRTVEIYKCGCCGKQWRVYK